MSGFVVLATPRGTERETTLMSLAEVMVGSLPGPSSGMPQIWCDAEEGITIATPGSRTTEATLHGLSTVENEAAFAVTGMHGTIDGLRQAVGAEQDEPADVVIKRAVRALDPHALAEALNNPLAFAIWDSRRRQCSIIRDRVGSVPLFHARIGNQVLISTHLNPFFVHPDFDDEVDQNALAAFLRHRMMALPWTLLRNVRQQPPATIITVHPSDRCPATGIVSYWSIRSAHLDGLAHPLDASPAEISSHLESLVVEAIERTSASPQTPVGVSFSAGIDSNLVAAVAQSTAHPVYTMTCGFSAAAPNETEPAATMAGLLGTQHTSIEIGPGDLLDAIESVPAIYGQPHADQAGLPAIIMARKARDVVPVVLCGDGGNTLFSSNWIYYQEGHDIWATKERVHPIARKPLTFGFETAATATEPLMPVIDRLLPSERSRSLRPSRLRRIADVFRARNPEWSYRIWTSDNSWPSGYLADRPREAKTTYTDPRRWLHAGDIFDRFRHVELQHIAIGHEVSKHEAPLTAAGVGYRAPLLDPAVIEFSLRIPESVRGYNGIDRWASVDIVRRRLPEGAPMPKQAGFSVPTDIWMRTSLRDWAESLLSEEHLKRDGLFHVKRVREEWRQHLTGKHDRRYVLWPILMTLVWRQARIRS